MARVLIGGCGFVGLAAARLFYRGGYDVTGIVSSEESAARLSGERFPVTACDITDREALKRYEGQFDAVVHCAAPSGPGASADDYRHIYLEGVQNLGEIVRPQKLLFTSSTSVYNQQNGEVVDETSEANPERETGRLLREAEEFVLGQNGFVARLAGIYGPGRSVHLRKFLDGTATLEGDGSRIINQIHRDDAAGAVFYLIAWHCAPGVYNVTDDNPMSQHDLYAWLAKHFSREMPRSEEPDADHRRGMGSKRVSNAKLHQQGWRCHYPSFREAVAEIVSGLVTTSRSGKVLRPVAA